MTPLKRRWTRFGNRIAVSMYRRLDGRLSSGSKKVHVLMITTPGRRTGVPRSTCVRYLETSSGFLVWGTGSGSRRDPDWFQNLRKVPTATVQVMDRELEMRPRELLGAERDATWSDVILAEAPEVIRYERKAGRTIPVAILEPVHGTTSPEARSRSAETSSPVSGTGEPPPGQTATRAAAVLAWVSGLGFGLPGVYAIAHVVRYGEIARFMGYPTYGEGVFERSLGVRTTVPLLSSFVIVCAAECCAGWLLWNRRRSGGALALGLLPVETVFWVGFSLPFGPLAGAARTALVVSSWSSLGVTSSPTQSPTGEPRGPA